MSQRGKWLIAVAIAVLGLGACSSAVRVDTQTEEQAIRDLDKRWVQAVASRDAATIVSLYAPDGVMMAPNSPAVRGTEALRTAWNDFLGAPNAVLTFEPTRIEVSESGDIAYDVGTYRMAFDGPQGRVEDEGNYITAWKKIDGQWRVASDVATSSKPLAPAPAPTPTPAPVVDVAIVETGDMETHTSGGVEWTDLNPPGFAPGMKLAALHGDPGGKGDYTIRLKFPPKYEFPAHWHPMAEHVTVLSGTLTLGMGERVDRSAAKAHQPGALIYIPPKMPHFGWVGGETVIQLHGMGPFTINLVTPAQ